MKVLQIVKGNAGPTGFGRYADSLRPALIRMGVDVRMTTPRLPGLLATLSSIVRRRFDLQAFAGSYPLSIPSGGDLVHLTTQTMATALLRAEQRPTVVTVHDIFPYLLRHRSDLSTFRHPVDRFCYGLAMKGLERADAVIAVSAYTRDTLVEALRIAPARISVVHEAVDHEVFRPRAVSDDVRTRASLSAETPCALYVGTEDPRKNLSGLVRAFARVRSDYPSSMLLLVGPRATGPAARLGESLGVRDALRFVGPVTDDDLCALYNLADAVVAPAFYEGFGFPALEALACGAPVIAARGGSLPEIVGDSAMLVPPGDDEALAEAISRTLGERENRLRWREAGVARAAGFSWARAARETLEVYERTIANRLAGPAGLALD